MQFALQAHNHLEEPHSRQSRHAQAKLEHEPMLPQSAEHFVECVLGGPQTTQAHQAEVALNMLQPAKALS